MIEQIAKIEKTTLGYEDHGIMTAYLHVSYGGSGQGVGGYALDQFDEATQKRHGHRCGMDFIMGVMKACGVRSWEKIAGRTIVVIKEGDDEWTGRPIGIKPLPTEPGEEFIFATAFEGMES